MSGDDQRPGPDAPADNPPRAQQTPRRAPMATQKGPPLTHLKENADFDSFGPPPRTRRSTSPLDDDDALPSKPSAGPAPQHSPYAPPGSSLEPDKSGVSPVLIIAAVVTLLLMAGGCVIGFVVTYFLLL